MKVSDLILTAIAAFLCGFVVVANEITCYKSPWTISINDRDGVQGYKNVSNATCPKINVIAGGTGTRIYHNVTMPSEQGCDVNVECECSQILPAMSRLCALPPGTHPHQSAQRLEWNLIALADVS